MRRNFLNIVRQRPLKVLVLSEINIATFVFEELRNAFPHLQVLNLSRAGIAAMAALGHVFLHLYDQDVTSRQLKILDLSYRTGTPKITDIIFGSLQGDFTFYIPPNLEEIYKKKCQ